MDNSTTLCVKFPADSSNVTVSFADVLVGGEQIVSGVLGTSTPTGLTVSSLSFTGTTISLNVAAGTDKQSYGVQVTANTDAGHVYTKVLAVVINSDLAADYQNTNVDAFQALVGKLEAGTAALGKAAFMFPGTVDTTSGIVTWDLLDQNGVVLANGQAFDYQTIAVASGKRAEAQAVITAPSNTTPTLDGQSYQLRWTLTLNGQQYFSFESLQITGPATVPEGVEDVIEMDDVTAFTIYMVSDQPWDTVTVDVYDENTKIVVDAPTAAPTQTADGWQYMCQFQPDPNNLMLARLESYTVVWKTSNVARPGYVERQTGRLFVVNASIMAAVTDMRTVIAKAETTILGTKDILFTDTLLLAYLRRGKDAFNIAYGMFTAFDMTNAQGPVREYWMRYSEITALRAQFLAEGEKVFNFSGQAIQLDSDRTTYYQQLADNIEQRISEECKMIKQNLIKKGILGGDGNLKDLTAMRHGSNGAVAITITPASTLGYRFARRF
jgi:hypothetical protein